MKRFLALALSIVMVLCTFAGCGPKDDDGGKSNTGNTGNTGTKGNGVLMGISVGDPGELLKLFTGENPIADIKDIYLEFAANDKSELIYGLGAKLFGEKHALKLFYGEDIVINAPTLTDKNYGISVEALMEMIMSFQSSPEVDSSVVAPAVDGDVNVGTAMNPSVVMELLPVLANYGDDLLEELKTNAGLTVTEDSGKLKIVGRVTSDAAAVVVTNLFIKLCADDEFMSIMSAMFQQSVEDLRKDLPEKDAMLAEFKNDFAELQFYVDMALILDKTTDELLTMDIIVYLDKTGDSMAASFDAENKKLSFRMYDGVNRLELKYDNGNFDLVVDVDDQLHELSISVTDTKITGFLKQDDQMMVQLSVDIFDDGFDFVMSAGGSEVGIAAKETNGEVVLTLSANGAEAFKVNMTKKVSGTKTTFTVKSMSLQNVTLDISAAKLSFYVDTDYTLEKAPAYESLENKTETELQAILEKIMIENQELIQKLTALFAGGSAVISAAA